MFSVAAVPVCFNPISRSAESETVVRCIFLLESSGFNGAVSTRICKVLNIIDHNKVLALLGTYLHR